MQAPFCHTGVPGCIVIQQDHNSSHSKSTGTGTILAYDDVDNDVVLQVDLLGKFLKKSN